MDRQFNAVDHLVKSFGLCSTTRSHTHCAANDSQELDEQKAREKKIHWLLLKLNGAI